MDSLAVFSFHDTNPIRVQMIDGEPWFVAQDVCAALKISNVSDALNKLDNDEKLRLGLTDAQKIDKMARVINIISESGLYTLILRCRDAVTPGTIPYRFRKWVTGEVLPSIRKTGAYQYQPLAPKLAGEPLTAQGHDELKWLISDVAQSFHFSRCWVSGIWFALRRATGNPSPNPFLTTELPVIVHELRRVLKAAEYAQLHMRKYEADVLKIVIRGGQDATSVSSLDLKELNAVVDTALLPARFEVAMEKLLKLESRVP